MKNEMVKIRLLNDGGYAGMENVNFPVEFPCEMMNGGMARVSRNELIIAGAGPSELIAAFWYFPAKSYELVTPAYNKPLINAVFHLCGDLDNLVNGYNPNMQDMIILSPQGKYYGCNEYYDWQYVCTIEEFNQCVEAMKNSDGVVAFGQYSSFKQPLTKENSDYSFYGGRSETKVEYVEVNYNDAVYYFVEQQEDIYPGPDGDCEPISLQHYISELAEGAGIVYRKVETEISEDDIKIKALFDKYNGYGVDDVQLLDTITDMVNNGDL